MIPDGSKSISKDAKRVVKLDSVQRGNKKKKISFFFSRRYVFMVRDVELGLELMFTVIYFFGGKEEARAGRNILLL